MSVATMIERLRRIPDGARSFECDAPFARLHYGIDEVALRELAAAGLPSRMEAGALRFEHGDLHYIGLRLRSASTYLWAVRRWAAGLDRFARRDVTEVNVGYVPQLPADAGPVRGVAHLPDGKRRAVVLENGRSAAEARVVLSGRWPALPPAAARVVNRVAATIDFCLLPPALRRDTALVRRIGLSDCLTAAHLTVEEWSAAGLEGRVGRGLLVSLPYSTQHTWPEVRVGERWVPADPLMLGVMCDFGGLDPVAWPPDRSTGPALRCVDGCPDALLTTDAGEVETTFITSVADGAEPSRAHATN